MQDFVHQLYYYPYYCDYDHDDYQRCSSYFYYMYSSCMLFLACPALLVGCVLGGDFGFTV